MEAINTNDWIKIACAVIVGVLFFYVLSRDKFKMIKDPVNMDDPPYSLSRSQMAFWMLVILVSLFYVWFANDQLIALDKTILALIGVSAGTTIGGYYLDKRDAKKSDAPPHQQTKSSNNFFINICSDSNGLSVHRFQNVIFTIFIGFYVINEVISKNKFPPIDGNLLLIMGISSATYLAIKQSENITDKKKEEESK